MVYAISLEENFDDLLPYANFLIDHIRTSTTVDMIGDSCIELSSHYRALGICELLVDGDVDAFFHFLIHSALTSKYYLERCVQEGRLDQPERRASLLDPLFDAVAANQFNLAAELASISSKTIFSDFEDPIDFAYSGVVQALVGASSANTPASRKALDTYEFALAGYDEERLNICRAIDQRDERKFNRTFPLLVDAHEREMARLESSIRSSESTYAPNCFVFVEGLALLRIAERAGLRTESEYPLCPSLARVSNYSPFVPNSFPNLPLGS